MSQTSHCSPLSLSGRRIALGVCGSVAAYKAADLCRLFVRQGAQVSVVMTEAATRFVTPLTFEALSGRPVWTSMFSAPGEDSMPHISLARDLDLFVVAPASADLLARAAAGRADDLLSALLLTNRAPVLLAPAMNPAMWAHPLTQANVRRLVEQCDCQLVGPDSGDTACGDQGAGRMAAPEAIAEAAQRTFKADLAGVRLVVTAGPTQEALDPVRYLSNHSSGKMGYALARGAARRAAAVTLISGPVALPPPPGVTFVAVTTAAEMLAQVQAAVPRADVLIMAAAVADYRVATPADHKLHRGHEPLTLQLVPNPDILATVGHRRQGTRPFIVGFALETDELLASAQAKLARKKCDLLVANLAQDALGQDTSQAFLLDSSGVVDQPGLLPKDQLADRILDAVERRLAKKQKETAP